jgi:hypothetical protein
MEVLMPLRFLRFAPVAIALLVAVPGSAQQETPARWPFHGRLGVEVQAMTEELRAFFGAPADRGVLVARVAAERPAERAGVQVGDVLVAAAGEPLGRPIDLVAVVARAPAQEKLALELVRKGERLTIEVVPEGDPTPHADLEAWHALGEKGRRGGHPGVQEILRRLDAIEQRLDGLGSTTPPAPPPAPPADPPR